ncbi:hypothetical protein QZH41_017005 [Actinostola sp. cb2023]|nr:hypothetical protein QZH41_017005 [Actinostola sp. cb2023]
MKIYQTMFLFVFVMVTKGSYGCDDPLGMKSGEIGKSQITASSDYVKGFDVLTYARLDMQPSKTTQWIQIDFVGAKKITAIATQGHPAGDQWIKTYQILSGNDPNSLTLYDNGKIFTGNTDSNTVVKHIINPPIVGRYIRVLMKSWQTWPIIRMELYGCVPGNYNICQLKYVFLMMKM